VTSSATVDCRLSTHGDLDTLDVMARHRNQRHILLIWSYLYERKVVWDFTKAVVSLLHILPNLDLTIGILTLHSVSVLDWLVWRIQYQNLQGSGHKDLIHTLDLRKQLAMRWICSCRHWNFTRGWFFNIPSVRWSNAKKPLSKPKHERRSAWQIHPELNRFTKSLYTPDMCGSCRSNHIPLPCHGVPLVHQYLPPNHHKIRELQSSLRTG